MFNIIKNVNIGKWSSSNFLGSVLAKNLISTGRNVLLVNVSRQKGEIKRLQTEFVQQEIRKISRTMSTLKNHSEPFPTKITISKGEILNFMAIFPDIVRELTEAANSFHSSEASKWFARALEYNLPQGKKNRGILTVITYKNLADPKDITEENLKLARILGWCTEMVQCFFLIYDDIMDGSSTRRGQPCWHKLEDVGIIAFNDTIMIENAIYILMKKYFSHMDCYVNLLELFHEITFITSYGQSLDLLNANTSVYSFDMNKYKAIVAYKTAYYTFYLPFALAMHLAGIKDQETFRQSKAILLEMGHFFQVQDDFLDTFGDPEVTGKIGSDIQDNKCSWLAVVCMQKANEEQKKIMVECYGKKDPEKVARVRELYKTLDLPNTYAIYEEESYNSIKTRILQNSPTALQKSLLQFLNKIYHRDS